jgi:hypothetical protein
MTATTIAAVSDVPPEPPELDEGLGVEVGEGVNEVLSGWISDWIGPGLGAKAGAW